jgi:putative salt-induced outer membrane protein YdiY
MGSEVLPVPDEALDAPSYVFFDPRRWLPSEGWNNSFEIGINGSTGNAESFSMRTGARIERKLDPATFTLDARYARTLANSIETQHNGLVNSNLEAELGDSRWTTFFKSSLEYDEFKAFDVRTALNAGVGYHLLKSEEATFIARFGSGVSRELGGPDDRYVPEALYGLEFERQLTGRQKFYATTDYFPDWSDYRDYRLVTNAGWEFLLDEEDNLSLKLGVVDRYDSTPHGRKPNDLDYSLLLLWKH